MSQQGYGTLIGITSTVIESASTPARMGAYTVGKIALRGLLRELHRELSPFDIRVFAVAPELMRTKLTADLPEKFFELVEQRSGSAAITTPKQVAETVVRAGTDLNVPSGLSLNVFPPTLSDL
jgi:NAD(P)-dependent dehydrogenase (short-subunit alcohol dehydrogenase family)